MWIELGATRTNVDMNLREWPSMKSLKTGSPFQNPCPIEWLQNSDQKRSRMLWLPHEILGRSLKNLFELNNGFKTGEVGWLCHLARINSGPTPMHSLRKRLGEHEVCQISLKRRQSPEGLRKAEEKATADLVYARWDGRWSLHLSFFAMTLAYRAVKEAANARTAMLQAKAVAKRALARLSDTRAECSGQH